MLLCLFVCCWFIFSIYRPNVFFLVFKFVYTIKEDVWNETTDVGH